MSSDDRTPLPAFRMPVTQRKRILTLRRGRERAVKAALAASQEPPEWEDKEEPSVTRYVEGPDGRVSVEGFGDDVAKVIEAAKRAKHPSIYARAKESLAPVSKKMESPKGKLVALLSLIASIVVAALLNELAKRGIAPP